MLIIVNEATGKVLGRFDAWDRECMNKASDFITAKGMFLVKRERTFGGDMVLWVRDL